MCVPPIGVVMQQTSPAFHWLEDIEREFETFVGRLARERPSPPEFTRYLNATLDFHEFGGGFLLRTICSTITSCHPTRYIPAAAEDEILFDTKIMFQSIEYHLTVLVQCTVLQTFDVQFFPPPDCSPEANP